MVWKDGLRGVFGLVASWVVLVALGGDALANKPIVAVARLIVKVRPRTARVRVTGPGGFRSTGGASWERADLKPGRYNVLAGASGYASTQRAVTLGGDDLKTLTIALLRPGTLVVTGNPRGARVEVKGPGGFSIVKGLPVTISGAAGGTYRVKVSRAGYGAVEREAVVEPGRSAKVEVRLVQGGADGAPMVSVPAGTFLRGSSSGDADEKPQRRVYLSAFSIDKHEVTVAQYRRCVRGGRCSKAKTGTYCNWSQSGRGQHPLNCVNWAQAKAYCAWAGKRLPTEAEWEKAARGTDGRTYPWGNAQASCQRAVMREGGSGCGKKSTWPVGSKSPAGDSPYGAQDMAGNVWEWTADWYGKSYYSGAPVRNPEGPSAGPGRVVRGGSWDSIARYVRAANRSYSTPADRTSNLGFRCARTR